VPMMKRRRNRRDAVSPRTNAWNEETFFSKLRLRSIPRRSFAGISATRATLLHPDSAVVVGVLRHSSSRSPRRRRVLPIHLHRVRQRKRSRAVRWPFECAVRRGSEYQVIVRTRRLQQGSCLSSSLYRAFWRGTGLGTEDSGRTGTSGRTSASTRVESADAAGLTDSRRLVR